MRWFFALSSLLISVYLAYRTWIREKEKLKLASFLTDFTDKLTVNNTREMLPLGTVLSESYRLHYGEEKEFENSEKAVLFLQERLTGLQNYDLIIASLKKYASSSEGELSLNADELKNAVNESLVTSKESYERYGKIAFLLYPGTVLALILVLL